MILNKDFSIIWQVQNIVIKVFQLLLGRYNIKAILPITKFNNRLVILMRWHRWMSRWPVSKKYWNTEYGLGYIFIKKGQQPYLKTEF